MNARATPVPGTTWERLSDLPACVLYRPHLNRTVATALLVGTVLFVINHLYGVVNGHAGTGVWIATAVSYVVPFCTANLGMLAGSRRTPEHAGEEKHAGDGKQAGDGKAGRRSGARLAPTWERPGELARCLLHPPFLTRVLATALVVGTMYFAINQLATVLRGHATAAVWAASGLTYLVPFCVASTGLLIGCRRTSLPAPESAGPAARIPGPAAPGPGQRPVTPSGSGHQTADRRRSPPGTS